MNAYVQRFEDFQHVDDNQLTPFDFWEIVHDSKALVSDESDPQKRKFIFRIDTLKIIKNYRKWLKNVVKHKFEKWFPNTLPQAIVTVREDTGINFSILVADSIGVPPNKIYPISREILRKITASGVNNGIEFIKNFSRILIVDDGINNGETISSLIEACRSQDVVPMGVFVLDCRLDDSRIASFELLLQGNLLYLYKWSNTSAKMIQ